MMVFTGKVNNNMSRPKAAILRLSQLQFCLNSVIYMRSQHHYATSLSNIDIYIYMRHFLSKIVS